MTKSVIIVTYRRLNRLNEILTAWLNETPDVWLCDCSAVGFHTSLPIKIIRAIPDPGNRIRHAVAMMTIGELVIKADDDICPRLGLANDFEKAMSLVGPAILGIHGRKFRGPNYYTQTTLYASKSVTELQPVDFVGVITCSSRQFLSMDLAGCSNEFEDIYWQMRAYPKAPKFVIPSDKFHHLDECHDKGRLCGNASSKMIRAAFYKRWYERNYTK